MTTKLIEIDDLWLGINFELKIVHISLNFACSICIYQFIWIDIYKFL